MTVDIYRPTAEDGLSLAELALYHEIIAYRAGLGLPALPLSRALTITAGRHVADTRENIWADRLSLPAGANLHSWSDAPYSADGSEPRGDVGSAAAARHRLPLGRLRDHRRRLRRRRRGAGRLEGLAAAPTRS